MPVSRDRVSRPVDISSLLPDAQRPVEVTVDEPGLRLRVLNASKGKSSGTGSGSIRRRGSQSHRRRMRGNWYLNRGLLPVDQENRSPLGVRSGQGRRSVLPSWHPRTPLRDVTAIVRAIERRRAELFDQRTETNPIAEEANPTAEPSNTQPKNETNIPTQPTLNIALKNKGIITDDTIEDSELITPQKKLLNSIDNVRKIWVEEQQRVEKTPAAKRAERERKVRTLMSMR